MHLVSDHRHPRVATRWRWLIALVAGLLLAGPSVDQASARTFVSLTFDDGIATQYAVRSVLASHGMHGTFFINSNHVGSGSYYMTWSQIHSIADDGNEIGGHTLDHVNLTTVSSDEARRQVCDDRNNLIGQGFSVSTFAYPYGAANASVEQIMLDCGYVVARDLGGLYSPATPASCASCPYSNRVPLLPNPHWLRTSGWISRPYTLQDYEGWVTQAEDHGGGWVPLYFHDICNGCAEGSLSLSEFSALLDWLQARKVNGTDVRAVNEMTSASTAMGPYGDGVLATPGLLSYWRLGESSGTTAADQKGANPGTYKGGVALGNPGALTGNGDTAAGFDGANDEVTAGGPPVTSGGSIEGWFRWTGGTAVMRDNTSSGGWILAFDNGGKLAYRVGGKTFTTSLTTASVRNGWHHFVVTVAGGDTAFYVDATLTHNGTGAPAVTAAMPWHVMRNGIYADYAGGRADEVAVYNLVLSPKSVLVHYLDGVGSVPQATVPAQPTGLTATAGDGTVSLDWADNGDPDLTGYNVYRSTTDGGPYTKINSSPVGSSGYVDTGVVNGLTYYYVVKAVNSANLESAQSQQTSAAPSDPFGPSYGATILATPGLTSYWRLGDSSGTTAADQKGANPGTYKGGVALVQPGALIGDGNTAAGFDGANDEVTAGGPSLTSAGTIEGWFYWTSGVAVMRDNTSGAGWILAYDNSGKLAYRAGGKTFVTSRTTASVGNGWHQLALTVSGGATAFYVDGAQVHSGTGAPATAAAMPWHVMRNGLYDYAGGRADEVAVYGSALSAATVLAHYHAAGH